MTQQQVADALAERGIKLDRVSVLRIEGGTQMPSAAALEAIADIFGLDLDTLLNRTPEQAAELRELRRMEPAELRQLLRIKRAAAGGD